MDYCGVKVKFTITEGMKIFDLALATPSDER